MEKLKRKQEGSVWVMLIFLIPLIVAVGALVTDAGYKYARTSQLQRAIDASALTGAYKIRTLIEANDFHYLNQQAARDEIVDEIVNRAAEYGYSIDTDSIQIVADRVIVNASIELDYPFKAILYGLVAAPETTVERQTVVEIDNDGGKLRARPVKINTYNRFPFGVPENIIIDDINSLSKDYVRFSGPVTGFELGKEYILKIGSVYNASDSDGNGIWVPLDDTDEDGYMDNTADSRADINRNGFLNADLSRNGFLDDSDETAGITAQDKNRNDILDIHEVSAPDEYWNYHTYSFDSTDENDPNFGKSKLLLRAGDLGLTQEQMLALYGAAYNSLKDGSEVVWALGYDGGSFILEDDQATRDLLAAYGIAVDGANVSSITKFPPEGEGDDWPTSLIFSEAPSIKILSDGIDASDNVVASLLADAGIITDASDLTQGDIWADPADAENSLDGADWVYVIKDLDADNVDDQQTAEAIYNYVYDGNNIFVMDGTALNLDATLDKLANDGEDIEVFAFQSAYTLSDDADPIAVTAGDIMDLDAAGDLMLVYDAATQQIIVSGSGYPANQDSIEIKFDNATVATVTADADGNFTQAINPPSWADGTHKVQTEYNPTSSKKVIDLDPQSATFGQTGMMADKWNGIDDIELGSALLPFNQNHAGFDQNDYTLEEWNLLNASDQSTIDGFGGKAMAYNPAYLTETTMTFAQVPTNQYEYPAEEGRLIVWHDQGGDALAKQVFTIKPGEPITAQMAHGQGNAATGKMGALYLTESEYQQYLAGTLPAWQTKAKAPNKVDIGFNAMRDDTVEFELDANGFLHARGQIVSNGNAANADPNSLLSSSSAVVDPADLVGTLVTTTFASKYVGGQVGNGGTYSYLGGINPNTTEGYRLILNNIFASGVPPFKNQFGAADLNAELSGEGGEFYRDNLTYGFNDSEGGSPHRTLTTGDVIILEPGNFVQQTNFGIFFRTGGLGTQPHYDWKEAKVGSPRIFMVPIVRSVAKPGTPIYDLSGRPEVEVLGTALFYLTNPVTEPPHRSTVKGNDDYIGVVKPDQVRGIFLDWVEEPQL